MRPPPAKTQDKKYKTRMCRYGAGTCPYGVSCSYAHSAVVFRAEKSTLRAVDAKSGSVRAQEELRPREPDEPPGEPTDVVSRLERLRALRDSGSVSAVEFEVLKQQVLREPGSFAAQAPVLLYRTLGPTMPDGTQEGAVLFGLALKAAMASGKSFARAGFTGSPIEAGDAFFQSLLDHPEGTVFAIDEPE